MFNPEKLIRKHILDIPGYEPILPVDVLSEQLGMSADQIIKLDANENPYSLPEQVKQALSDFSDIQIYPDPESRYLRQAISEYHNVPVSRIMVGAGADELIDLIMRALIDPGDFLFDCPPTFGMYKFDGDINNAEVISINRNKDFTIDIKKIIQKCQVHNPKLIFIASPNNPDGGLLSRDEFARLIELPLYIVLDEAYIDFAPNDTSFLKEYREYNNLIILRTFSKWAGLAGLRIGYGIFPEELAKHIWKIKQPYNISITASRAALAVLKEQEVFKQNCDRIIIERERLYKLLELIDWLSPYPSKANFILCKVQGRNALEIKNKLAERAIFIRRFDKPGLKDHLRISVGKPEDTDQIIHYLKEME